MNKKSFYYLESLYIILITLFLLIVIRPYKLERYNLMDTGLMLNLALANVSVMAYITAEKDGEIPTSIPKVIMICTAIIPAIFMLGYPIYWRCYSKRTCTPDNRFGFLLIPSMP